MSNIDFGLPQLEGILIIAIGGCGTKIGKLLYEKNYTVYFINSSEQDQSILNDVPDYLKFKMLGTKGANGNREKSKMFIKANYRKIIRDITTKFESYTHYFILTSTSGGTGSGSSILLSRFIKQLCPDKSVSFIPILPSFNESYQRKLNTLSFYNELLECNLDDFSSMFFVDNNNANSNGELDDFNTKVIASLDYIFNLSRNTTNIDDADLLQLLNCSGCVNVFYIDQKKTIDTYRLKIDSMFAESQGNAKYVLYDINTDDDVLEYEVNERFGQQDDTLYTFRDDANKLLILFGLDLPYEYFEIIGEYCEEHNQKKLRTNKDSSDRKIIVNNTIQQSKQINTTKSIDDIFNNLFGSK